MRALDDPAVRALIAKDGAVLAGVLLFAWDIRLVLFYFWFELFVLNLFTWLAAAMPRWPEPQEWPGWPRLFGRALKGAWNRAKALVFMVPSAASGVVLGLWDVVAMPDLWIAAGMAAIFAAYLVEASSRMLAQPRPAGGLFVNYLAGAAIAALPEPFLKRTGKFFVFLILVAFAYALAQSIPALATASLFAALLLKLVYDVSELRRGGSGAGSTP